MHEYITDFQKLDDRRNEWKIWTNDYRIGKARADKTGERYGDKTKSGNVNEQIEICGRHDYQIANNFFDQKDIQIYTWKETARQRKLIVDLM